MGTSFSGNSKKKKNKIKKDRIENKGQAAKMNNKVRRTIKLPPKFREFIQDPKMQREFIEFAQNKDSRPSMSELVAYSDAWITRIDGKKYNPDDISLNTYKLMRKDAQLQMGLKVIKLPIKAMKWWIVCDDKDIRAFLQYALERVWKSMLNSILNALDFGWSACEKVWEIQDIEVTRKEGDKIVIAYKGQAVLLKKLKDPDPSQISILVDNNGDFDGFEQKSGGGKIRVPAEKAFVFTNEKEFGNLYGKSLLRYAYDYWYWSSLMYQFLNRYFERRGTPPTIARAPAGKTNLSNGQVLDNLVLAQKAGESLTESSVVALPSSVYEGTDIYKWDLAYLKEDQRAEMFMSYIDHLNSMKLRALFVPERTVTQDSDMGSRAVAKTHLNVFLMGLEGMIQNIIDHFNQYLIPQLIRYNFGDQIVPAYIVTSGLRSDSKNLLKQIIVALIKKGDGVMPIDLVKALEELNLPIKDDVEDNLKPKKGKEEDDEDDDDKGKNIGDKNAKAEKSIDNLREEYRLCEVRKILESD